MVYWNVRIGEYTFSVNPSNLTARMIRSPGQLKILGRNISIVESMGTEGYIQLKFNGYLIDEGSGINKKADFITLYNAFSLNEPIQVVVDMFSGLGARGWGFVNEFDPVELGGRKYSYEYTLVFTVIGFANDWSRATIYSGQSVINDFGVTGDKVICLPIMASGSTETIDFCRSTDEGNIPCVVNPQLSYCRWEVTGSNDAWLGSGSLEYFQSGSESGWTNRIIQLRTRQDEATMPGMVELWLYTGSGQQQLLGYLETQVQLSGSTWYSGSASSNIHVKSATANRYENKYHTIGKIFYPASGGISHNLFVETWRGKPYAKLWAENSTEQAALTGVRYRLILNTGEQNQVFSTNFETETKISSNELSWALPHWVDLSNYASFGVEGRDKNTVGAPAPHSGLYSILLDVPATSDSTKRAEIDLNSMESLVADELFVSVWIYLPSDWALTSGGWWELADPYMTQNDPTSHYWPYMALQIWESGGSYQLILKRLAENGAASYPVPAQTWTPIVGQWFNLKYYVYRNLTNGRVKVWINNVLKFDVSGFPTKHSTFTGWMTNPTKAYYNENDDTLHRMWVDDLQIFNSDMAGINLWQNFTAYRSGSSNITLWAQSGSYTSITGSGTLDTANTGSTALLSTDYPLVSTSNMTGFIRPLKDIMNHVGVQYSGSVGGSGTGSYWYECMVEYTGSNILYGQFMPEVYIFAQNFGSCGSRTESDLASEALYQINSCEDIIQYNVT